MSVMMCCTTGPRSDALLLMTVENFKMAGTAIPARWITTAAGWGSVRPMACHVNVSSTRTAHRLIAALAGMSCQTNVTIARIVTIVGYARRMTPRDMVAFAVIHSTTGLMKSVARGIPAQNFMVTTAVCLARWMCTAAFWGDAMQVGPHANVLTRSTGCHLSDAMYITKASA